MVLKHPCASGVQICLHGFLHLENDIEKAFDSPSWLTLSRILPEERPVTAVGFCMQIDDVDVRVLALLSQHLEDNRLVLFWLHEKELMHRNGIGTLWKHTNYLDSSSRYVYERILYERRKTL